MEASFICTACGTQFPPATEPPSACPICEDPRQFVPESGQTWTTLEKLRGSHRNAFQQVEPNLIGIGTTPEFAIGQRALLLRTEDGNFLWDCLSLIDNATMEIIRGLGVLRGIAVSHPHFYSAMTEWSRAFGDVPVYLHAADREWVINPSDAIEFWEGAQKELAPGVTLVHCGGHFEGATVLHWANGAAGRGALLTGDILRVGPDGFVSFMRSFPNLIPLPATSVHGIANALEPVSYDRIYGAWWGTAIERDASAIVAKSVKRYLNAITFP